MISLRVFSAASLLLMSLFLSGCFDSDEEDTNHYDFELQTFEGTLQSLGNAAFDSQATHLLRLDDGTILYVYSEFYDLNDPEYKNVRVEAEGVVIPADEDGKDTLSIESLTVLGEDDASDVLVSVQTYVNTTMGFSLEYQSDWQVEEAVDQFQVTFTAPVVVDEDAVTDQIVNTELQDRLVIGKTDDANLQQLDIEEWFMVYVALEDDTIPYTLSKIGFDQLPALKMVDDQGATYYIADGVDIYIITTYLVQDDLTLEHTNLMSTMLYSFDLASDGYRETTILDDSSNTDEDTDTSSLDGTRYDDVMEALAEGLPDLKEVSEDWVATRYDFVDPNYVYVDFMNDDGESSGRLLLEYASDYVFTTLAVFEPGSTTDWKLISGSDVASGKERTSVDVSSGTVTTIQEGYRSFESGTLSFQMQYPSGWYYTRSGESFYFSTEPASAENALVTLTVVDTPVSDFEEESDGGEVTLWVPRDDISSFQLTASSEYEAQLGVMAHSIVSTQD